VHGRERRGVVEKGDVRRALRPLVVVGDHRQEGVDGVVDLQAGPSAQLVLREGAVSFSVPRQSTDQDALEQFC